MEEIKTLVNFVIIKDDMEKNDQLSMATTTTTNPYDDKLAIF